MKGVDQTYLPANGNVWFCGVNVCEENCLNNGHNRINTEKKGNSE